MGRGAPPLALIPARPGQPCDEQTQVFADQVIVARRMQRQVTGDEMAVLEHGVEPPALEALPLRSLEQDAVLSSEQVPGDRPVHQSESMLERIVPVRAQRIRTLFEPA